mmetsp:Transcript_6521/g.10134  ORF Transcript_6521/g.10134 Transcript_6521/m.10134 type:complete len:333 (-) Transcript_6521:616-1614(-)
MAVSSKALCSASVVCVHVFRKRCHIFVPTTASKWRGRSIKNCTARPPANTITLIPGWRKSRRTSTTQFLRPPSITVASSPSPTQGCNKRSTQSVSLASGQLLPETHGRKSELREAIPRQRTTLAGHCDCSVHPCIPTVKAKKLSAGGTVSIPLESAPPLPHLRLAPLPSNTTTRPLLANNSKSHATTFWHSGTLPLRCTHTARSGPCPGRSVARIFYVSCSPTKVTLSACKRCKPTTSTSSSSPTCPRWVTMASSKPRLEATLLLTARTKEVLMENPLSVAKEEAAVQSLKAPWTDALYFTSEIVLLLWNACTLSSTPWLVNNSMTRRFCEE